MARDDRPLPDAPDRPVAPDVPPTPVRVSGLLVAVQGLLAAVVTAVLAVGARTSPMGVVAVLGEAGFFLIVAVTLLAVGAGLVRGRRWARTPALVTQLLLLPVAYSLLSSGRTLLGVLAGAFVFATFMLLINERSRLWSMSG